MTDTDKEPIEPREWYHPPRPFRGEPRIIEDRIFQLAPTRLAAGMSAYFHTYVNFHVYWETSDVDDELDMKLSTATDHYYAHDYLSSARYDPESDYIKLPEAWKLNGKEYKQLQKLCKKRWGHLVRPVIERWHGLTDACDPVITRPGGCRTWLGLYDEEKQTPYFWVDGRKINARSVPWSRKGRRTCGNKYCVRKEHAQGYLENPDALTDKDRQLYEYAARHEKLPSIEEWLQKWNETLAAFRVTEDDMRAIEVARSRYEHEADNSDFDLPLSQRLPEDEEGYEE